MAGQERLAPIISAGANAIISAIRIVLVAAALGYPGMARAPDLQGRHASIRYDGLSPLGT
jgi:hypothetical protein